MAVAASWASHCQKRPLADNTAPFLCHTYICHIFFLYINMSLIVYLLCYVYITTTRKKKQKTRFIQHKSFHTEIVFDFYIPSQTVMYIGIDWYSSVFLKLRKMVTYNRKTNKLVATLLLKQSELRLEKNFQTQSISEGNEFIRSQKQR